MAGFIHTARPVWCGSLFSLSLTVLCLLSQDPPSPGQRLALRLPSPLPQSAAGIHRYHLSPCLIKVACTKTINKQNLGHISSTIKYKNSFLRVWFQRKTRPVMAVQARHLQDLNQSSHDRERTENKKVKIYVISLMENDQMLEGEMKPILFAL